MIKKIPPFVAGKVRGGIALAKKKLGLNGKASAAERAKLAEIEAAFPTVWSTTETLGRIIKNKATICRFGDAEFDISNAEQKDDPYQRPSEELSRRLREILEMKSTKDLIIAIPPFNAAHNNLRQFYKDLSFWEWYWLMRFDKLKPHLKQKEYGNSFVSRNSVFYENDVSEIKKIWSGRKVVFVVGKGGRFNFEPRLFDTIVDKQMVYVPATSAFDEYDRILSESLAFDKDYLFLIAAGPTATLLAYDLHKAGYQAIDMGHITNCYLEFLGEAGAPESIPMKR